MNAAERSTFVRDLAQAAYEFTPAELPILFEGGWRERKTEPPAWPLWPTGPSSATSSAGPCSPAPTLIATCRVPTSTTTHQPSSGRSCQQAVKQLCAFVDESAEAFASLDCGS
ncbi:DUF6000 family protein [Streptomyces sp. NPDC006514]|uniref:DUF6000 family protein n=1 Tax=Streptomyces sp. NPDC006514 TaxID=3154308 RepID=UPI0033A6EF2C